MSTRIALFGLRLIAVTGLAIGLAVPVAAQDTGTDQPQAKKRPLVEEIVVTATKREESLMDVPIAISAFTGENLQARGVESVQDLSQVAPSLSVYASNSTTNGGTLRIRGMGTTGNNPGLESAVGSFIDGVYLPRAGILFSTDFVDLERVEVLRGPQGTLFGKNTSAGAVQLITRKPSLEDWGGTFQSSYGNYDYWAAAGTITGPIVPDVLGMRLTGSWRNRRGFYDQIAGPDNRFYQLDRFTIRGQLLYAPTSDFDARFIFDVTQTKEDCCQAAFKQIGASATMPGGINDLANARFGTSGTGFINSNESDGKMGSNLHPFENVNDWGVSLEMNWRPSEKVTLTSITAFRDFQVDRSQDVDFTGADLALPTDRNPEEFANFSQELRLAGTWEALDWLVGLYGYTEHLKTSEQILFGSQAQSYFGSFIVGNPNFLAVVTPGGALPEGSGYFADWETRTGGLSAFTHNTYHFTDAFSATLGVRWSWEQKNGRAKLNNAPAFTAINTAPVCRVGFLRFSGLGSAFCDNYSWERSRVETAVTGTGSLNYAVNENINTYISYSRGYKAGGFNLDQQSFQLTSATKSEDSIEFQPEFANAYEVGMKSTLLDGAMQVNVAGFFTKFQDFQLNTFTGLGFIISNLDKVKSRGVELEMDWQVAEGVEMRGGVTYADTRYGNHLAPMPASNRVLEGHRITHAPPWTATWALAIDQPIPGTEWSVFGNVNMSYRGRHNTGSDLDPQKLQSAYTLWNAQLGFRPPGSQWDFLVWGYNLFDRSYNTVVFDSVFQGAPVSVPGSMGSWHTFLGAPRTFGLTIRYRFGEAM